MCREGVNVTPPVGETLGESVSKRVSLTVLDVVCVFSESLEWLRFEFTKSVGLLQLY